ncbi:alkaline phosphatase, partial [Actinomadura adrarensis]
PASAPVGVELVASSIASDGDGYHDPVTNATVRAENPHITHIDQRRGYVLCRTNPGMMQAEFHTVPYVSRKNAPSSVSATFTVLAGGHSFTSV